MLPVGDIRNYYQLIVYTGEGKVTKENKFEMSVTYFKLIVKKEREKDLTGALR